MNSIFVSFVVSCLLALINIGSTIALNNITSLSLVAILSSYIVSIGCLFWRRITNQPLLPAKFKLSKPVGLALNGFSLIFLVFTFIFAFFPGSPDPTVEMMNWACLVSIFPYEWRWSLGLAILVIVFELSSAWTESWKSWNFKCPFL